MEKVRAKYKDGRFPLFAGSNMSTRDDRSASKLHRPLSHSWNLRLGEAATNAIVLVVSDARTHTVLC